MTLGPISRRNRSGIALLMVLWTVAVIAIISMSFSFVARTEVMSTISFGDRIRDRFAAEAGVRQAITEIYYARTGNEDSWSLGGTPFDVRLSHSAFRVEILPEESRIDLNRSSPKLLRGLFIQLGLTEEDADAVVDAIQDWRDPDDLVRPFGAEDGYYASLDPPYAPRNADFETVDEVRLVRGITAELWEGSDTAVGLSELLTVYSPTGKIDPSTAPSTILGALGDVPEESIAEIMALRDDDTMPPNFALTRTRELVPGAAGLISATTGRTYRIHSTALHSGVPTSVGVEAVVTFQGNRAEVLYWNDRGLIGDTSGTEDSEDDVTGSGT